MGLIQVFRALLLFLILFNFPVPLFYNSAALAAALGSAYYFAGHQFPFNGFRSRYLVTILLSLLGIIVLSLAPPLIHFTFDFSILKTFILQLALLLILAYVLPILLPPPKPCSSGPLNGYYSKQALQLLIIVFACQSVIQVAGFIFPAVADIVHFFQEPSVAKKNMGGIRALALSGNPFFDLSAAYALVYLFFVKYVFDKGRFTAGLIIIFILLVTGTFFAGRTGFVGLIFAILLLLSYASTMLFKLSSIAKAAGLSGLVILISLYLLPADVKSLLFDRLLPFAFEYIYSYLETGKFTTASTEILSTMYFPVEWSTFFWGDGRYMGKNGGYYMSTDAGYMRHILYYGVFGSMALACYQFLFFYSPLKLSLQQAGLKKKYNDTVFWFLLLVLLFVLHYKGEVVGFLPSTQMIILFAGMAYVKDRTATG